MTQTVRPLFAFLLSLKLVAPLAATGNDSLVRFDGGIGVIPVANAAGPANADGTFPNVTRNTVRGILPAGQIWVIAALKAAVFTDGRISVRGRGLLLGGGDAIGFNGNASVFATLICEATAPFTQHSTSLTGVPLDANGDFRIDDELSSPPQECASPVLLIRTTGGTQPWFATGIVAGGSGEGREHR